MKVDFEEVFKDRLEQVKKDIRKCNKNKDWETKRVLIREKRDLEVKLQGYKDKEK